MVVATDYLRELDELGYCVMNNHLSQSKVKELLDLVEQKYDTDLHQTFAGRPERELTDKFVYNMQYKGKEFIDVLGDPLLTDILMAKLNDPYYKHLPPDVPNYILGFYNARSSGVEMPLHTDTFVPSPGKQTWTMQVVFMLEDADKNNGSTMLVPGSHISGEYVDYDSPNIKYLTAKAGDVIIWDSRIWHGAAANKTGRSRWSLIATFSCWWVKQRTDMTRGMPNDMYQQLTDRQKQLLGFCSIPPIDEHERLNFKCGYDVLKPAIEDYQTR